MSIGQQTGALRLRYPHAWVEDALKELWGDQYNERHNQIFGGSGNRALFEYYVTRPLNDYYFDMIRHTNAAVPEIQLRGADDHFLRQNLDRWEGQGGNEQRTAFVPRARPPPPPEYRPRVAQVPQRRDVQDTPGRFRPHWMIEKDEEDEEARMREPRIGRPQRLQTHRPRDMVLAEATDEDEEAYAPPPEVSTTQIPDSQPPQNDDDTEDDDSDNDVQPTVGTPIVPVHGPVTRVPVQSVRWIFPGGVRVPVPPGLSRGVQRMADNVQQHPNIINNPEFKKKLIEYLGELSPLVMSLYGVNARSQPPARPLTAPPAVVPASQAPTLRINDLEDESEDSDLEF